MFISKNDLLAQNLVNILKNVQRYIVANSLTISIAESCTGGLLSHAFTSFSGSSNYFKGGVVAYSNDSKINFLNIQKNDIDNYGVVSEQVVIKMARSVRKTHNTDFGLATTGYLDGFQCDLSDSESQKHYAWICISGNNLMFSEKIILTQNRVENAYVVAIAILKLFVKEIL